MSGTTRGTRKGAAVQPQAAQTAHERGPGAVPSRMDPEPPAAPPAPRAPRLRLKLSTLDDVKAELARLYREGKAGSRDVAAVSKLANILGILGRLIVDNELAARVEALEGEQEKKHGR